MAPAWLVFLGCLMGIGVRTGHSLHLRLAPPIWRLLCSRRSGIPKMTKEELERAELPFTCLSANRCHTVDLIQFVRELAFCSQPCVETDCLSLLLSKSTNLSSSTTPSPPPSSNPEVLWSSVQASARVALSAFNSVSVVSTELAEPPISNASATCPGARLFVTPNTRPAYLTAVILFRRQEFERAIRLVFFGLTFLLTIIVMNAAKSRGITVYLRQGRKQQ
ncbi:unnamed protein product [Dibothriocephalus latus]|uniref:FZ domain-containing protein n=1 Tax=Dibothriocephalus latus TaxID=60516 RepID=A0A3P6PRN2_DIBLA|nr:unnamed protein product [Dibothriocephalus latus]